jgi:O-antigen/teichoic acid export membrane protein
MQQSKWAVIEIMAFPIMMFLATPLFLKSLGTEQFGQWMLLLTLNGLGGIAGLGMGATAVKEVSASLGRGDLPGASKAARCCLSITLISTLALSSLLFVLGSAVAPTLLFRIGSPELIQALLLASIAQLSLEQIDVLYSSVLKGAERFDISAKIEIWTRGLSVAATLAVAIVTARLDIVILVAIGISVIRALTKAIAASKLLDNGFLIPAWEKATIARALNFGKWTWLQGIAAVIFGTGDRFIVGATLGATALAHYSICLQLAQQVQTIPAAAAQTLFPKVSRSLAAHNAVRALTQQTLTSILRISLICALPLAVFAHPILSLWVGSGVADEAWMTLALLSLSFGILATNSVPHFAMLGLGKAQIVALMNLSAGVLALAGCWFGAVHYGLLGAGANRTIYAVALLTMLPTMFNALTKHDNEYVKS